MNFISPEIIIMGISLLIAISTPIITAIINSHHEIKMYKLRFYNEHKSEVIEGFLKTVGNCIYYSDESNLHSLGEYFGEIYLYTPPSMHDKITELSKCLQYANMDNDKARIIFIDISTELSKNPPRSEKI